MKRNSKMFLFIVMLLLTGSSCFLMTSCQKDYDGQLEIIRNQLKAGENSYTELKEQITSLEERVTTIEKQIEYLQPIITQYFIDNKSEIWLLFLIAHSKR